MFFKIRVQNVSGLVMPKCQFCEEKKTWFIVDINDGDTVAFYCFDCLSLEWWSTERFFSELIERAI